LVVFTAETLWSRRAGEQSQLDDGGGLAEAPETAKLLRALVEGDPDRRVILLYGGFGETRLERLPSGASLMALREIALLADGGRIELRRAPGEMLKGLPRIVLDPGQATAAAFSVSSPATPLFEQLFAGRVRSRSLARTEEVAQRLDAALSAARLSTEPFLWSAKDVWVRRYKGGAPRDIAHDFRFVRDVGQTTVLIRDPYALAEDGHDDNLEETAAFLVKLTEVIGAAPTRVEVMARQDKHSIPGAQGRKENRLRTLLGGKTEVKVKLVDGMRMEFHDRWVEVRPAGGGLHRFEVTAGVDRYMRSRSECAIIHVFQPAEPPAAAVASPGLPPVPRPRLGSAR
jgi:hypothetical protein